MFKLQRVTTMPKQSLAAMRVAFGVCGQYATIAILSLLMVTQVIGVVIFSGKALAYAPNEFVTTWKTDNTGVSNSNQVTIPTWESVPSLHYNYNINWGDGSSDTGVAGNITHTYNTPGTYDVEITGEFPGILCGYPSTDCSGKLLTVKQWGAITWQKMAYALEGASNLTVTATDVPDLSNVTSLESMFAGATSFNQNIDNWDVSNVVDMSAIFEGATSFNQPLDNWDTSRVTGMNGTFGGATSFNQPLSNWNVSSVTNMTTMFANATSFNQNINSWDVSNVQTIQGMFLGATSFNQPLNNWNVSGVTNNYGMESVFQDATSFNQNINSWDVSNVKDMFALFRGATSFNQPLSNWNVSSLEVTGAMFLGATSFNQPLNNWNVSHVYYFILMFAGATSFNQPLNNWNTSAGASMIAMFAGTSSFDQPLGTWDVSNLQSMDNMFNKEYLNLGPGYEFTPAHGLSAANYDATLTGWSAQSLRSNITFDAGNSSYCTAGTSRISIINNFNWTINDSGKNCVIVPEPDTKPPTTDPDPKPPIVDSEHPVPEPPVIANVPSTQQSSEPIAKPALVSPIAAPSTSVATQNSLFALAKRIPEPFAIAFPWLLLLLALTLVSIQYYQVRSEGVATRKLQADVERQNRLVDEQNNFVALTTHYLHTPLTVMEGEISLMVRAGTISQAEATKLQATLTSLSAQAEAVLAEEEHNKVE